MQQREIPFAGSDEELKTLLREFARLMGGLAHRSKNSGSYVLSMGGSLATNPSDIKWTARAVLDKGTLRIAADVVTYPWTRRRATRLMQARLDQLVDFTETKLRGGAVEKFRERLQQEPFQPIGPGVRGACIAISSWAAQITGALAGVLLVSLLLGLVLISQKVGELQVRADTLKSIRIASIPSQAELEEIDFGFRLGAAAMLMLPIVFFIGFTYGAVHVIGEIWLRASRLPFWTFCFFVLLLLFSVWSVTHPLITVPFAVLIPAAAHAGLSVVWAFRKERRREPGTPDPLQKRRRTIMIVGGALAGFVVLLSLVPLPGGDFGERLAGFRDRFLFNNAVGREVASFYYRYTLYAAEVFKPIYVDPASGKQKDWGLQRTVLVNDNDKTVFNQLRLLHLASDYTKDRNTMIAIPQLRHDLYAVRNDRELKQFLDNSGLRGRTIILKRKGEPPPEGWNWIEVPASTEKLAALVHQVSEANFGGREFSSLSHLGYLSVFFAAPVFLLLFSLGLVSVPLAVLYSKAKTNVAHAVVGGVFVVSFGVILVVLQSHTEEIRLIGEIREADSGLAEYLSSEFPDVRFEAGLRACSLLKKTALREPELFGALMKVLTDPDMRVRLWACGALGHYGDDRAVPALLERLKEEELFVRYRAAEALGQLRSEAAWEPLLDRMRNDAWYVGKYALIAIRRIDPKP